MLRCRKLDKHKQYLVSIGSLMSLTVASLSALNENRLDVYVSLFAVAYFSCSALFKPRRRWFDVVGASLFMVFCYVVAVRVMEILVK